jgi:hypothetical protein
MDKNVYDYILTEESAWKTNRVPLTTSKDWNMHEHIERCTNVSNGWFHRGQNDGLRPYNDVVTPIINVAFRSEGFDVKDIVPFVNDAKESYKSFIVKKRHPQWARKYELDTFIDDVVESSVIYDLVLVKNVNDVRPEVVDLKTIAFCDQTDVLAGPLCIKHYYTPEQISEFRGKWFDDKIEEAIIMAQAEKTISIASDNKVFTPGKYIETYELRGNMPESWIKEGGDMNKYVPQIHIVCFYTSQDGNKNGITLYKGKDKKITDNFKALKIDRIRSKGRACGRSIVETLFEPQVWANYDAIKIKQILDSAFNLVITDSEELGNQKLSELKANTILKQNKGDNTQIITSNLNNITAFQNHQIKLEGDARLLGSASEPQLGLNPVSGTPLGTTQTVVQQGQGIHEYRQGKIATFFSDVLYPEWILKWLVDDLNTGIKFSEEMSLDEMQEIYTQIAENEGNKQSSELMLQGKIVTPEMKDEIIKIEKEKWMKGGTRGFFETVKDELKDIPVDVFVNIKGKQRYMAQNADKLSNMIRDIIVNADRIKQIPGITKAYNQLLEESGMSAIDFSFIDTPATEQPTQPTQPALATG